MEGLPTESQMSSSRFNFEKNPLKLMSRINIKGLRDGSLLFIHVSCRPDLSPRTQRLLQLRAESKGTTVDWG